MAKVLVVDFDPVAVTAMTRLLTSDGYEVSPFTERAEALDALEREAFDVVITDVHLPHIDDGRAVVEATRTRHPHACLVVITTLAEHMSGDLVREGVCIVSDKPVQFDSVTRAVTECRARGGPGPHGGCHMRSVPPDHQLVRLRRQ